MRCKVLGNRLLLPVVSMTTVLPFVSCDYISSQGHLEVQVPIHSICKNHKV